MKGILRTSLLLAMGVAGFSQRYAYKARGLSDIIAGLQGGTAEKGEAPKVVTKEVTKIITKSIQAAAPPTKAVEAAGTGAKSPFLNSTVNAPAAPTVYVTVNATKISVVTMTVMVPAPAVATPVPAPQEGVAAPAAPQGGIVAPAAPQGGVAAPPAPQGGVAAPPAPQGGVAAPPAPQGGAAAPAGPKKGAAAPAALGAAQIAQKPNPVDINTLSLVNSLALGNLAAATAAV
ncbi:hypothetical protein DSL72_008593 [Monilinia vaccinii-corymbosi]|uniref:Yeast cell wall synthesis Kre9/Knh1 C-terminal domain-containing protein n=1 Tax=Monilinia vaccinii-corymbosi TaxID=61207 RepID=A0A8A3PRK0_9HELO|nr:hypothetical protein DSL72_008593 [Monilinia vaccinii-corymbosi]